MANQQQDKPSNSVRIFRCDVTLLEATFFSSREVSNTYYTEPLLGNFALAYAFGLVQSPYFNDGTIHYAEDLSSLNEAGVYVTPGTIRGDARFTLGQFNTQTDSYWYAFANNVIVSRPDGAWTEKSGPAWYIVWPDGRRRKVGLENRPQHGLIRYLALGNRAVAYLISPMPITVPSYIRLGKFMSKARVEATEVPYTEVEAENVSIPFLLNPADFDTGTTTVAFDLVNVPPTPLIRNSVLSGRFYHLGSGTYLPLDMRFGVESLA